MPQATSEYHLTGEEATMGRLVKSSISSLVGPGEIFDDATITWGTLRMPSTLPNLHHTRAQIATNSFTRETEPELCTMPEMFPPPYEGCVSAFIIPYALHYYTSTFHQCNESPTNHPTINC